LFGLRRIAVRSLALTPGNQPSGKPDVRLDTGSTSPLPVPPLLITSLSLEGDLPSVRFRGGPGETYILQPAIDLMGRRG
jgi:hypothetical protein